MSEPVLQLSAVAVEYGRGGERVRAVDGVDLVVARGETVGLVGESGCGKSSLARAAVGLEPLASGTVTFEGRDVAPLVPIGGSPPSLGRVPGGCPFHPRCRYAQPSCATNRPEPEPIAPGHLLACPPDPLRAAVSERETP